MLPLCRSSLALFLAVVVAAMVATTAHALEAPDNNSHWSLRNANHMHSHPHPDHDDMAQMMSAVLDRLDAQDAHIQQLQASVTELESKLEKADTLHRFLQTSDADCLPTFLETSRGPRCDFQYVTRFQGDLTIFNSDVIFNENVEFDTDADCMPIYNATSKQCVIRNNFTYNAEVEFRNKTLFTNESYVKFEKEVSFEDEVHFYDHVKMSKDLHVDGHTYLDGTTIDGDLKATAHTYLDGTDIDGDLDVSGESELHGRVYANKGIRAKDGIEIKTGKLDIKEGGARIDGHVTMYDNLLVEGDLEVLGNKVYSGDVTVGGKLTVENGARINTIHTSPALYVDGKSNFRNDMDVSKKITAGALDLDGEAGKYPQPLYVNGNGKFTGIVTATNFDFHVPTEAPVTPAPGPVTHINIDDVMVEISKRTIYARNVIIGGEFGVEDPEMACVSKRSLSGTSIKVQGLEAEDLIKSVNLRVSQDAMVGEDKILTTADAEMLPDAGAAAAAIGPVSCSCPVSDMDAFNEAVDSRVKNGNWVLGSVTADAYYEWVDKSMGTTKQISGGGGGGEPRTDDEIRGVVSAMTNLNCDCPVPEATVFEDTSTFCECPTIDDEYVKGIIADLDLKGDCDTCPTQEVTVTACGCDEELSGFLTENDLNGYAKSSELDGFLKECPCSAEDPED